MADAREIYLVRHAAAEERGESWPDDARRPLSLDGMHGMRRAAKGLVRLGVSFDLILSSPLLRARQTAEILASAFDRRPPIAVVDSLALDGTYAAVLADLDKHSRRRRVALVGHEPLIGQLAARLVGSRHAFEFRKGAVCRVDVQSLPPAGPGTLRWFATPAMLRAIRK